MCNRALLHQTLPVSVQPPGCYRTPQHQTLCPYSPRGAIARLNIRLCVRTAPGVLLHASTSDSCVCTAPGVLSHVSTSDSVSVQPPGCYRTPQHQTLCPYSPRGAIARIDIRLCVRTAPGVLSHASTSDSVSVQPPGCYRTPQHQTLCPYSPRGAIARLNIRLCVRTAPGVLSHASTSDSCVCTAPRGAIARISIRLFRCPYSPRVQSHPSTDIRLFRCQYSPRVQSHASTDIRLFRCPYSPRVQSHASTSDSVFVQPPCAIARANTVRTLKIPTSGSSNTPLLARIRKNTAYTGRNRQSPQPKTGGKESIVSLFLFFLVPDNWQANSTCEDKSCT